MSKNESIRLHAEFQAALKQRAYQAAQDRVNRLRLQGVQASIHDCLPAWFATNLPF